MLNPSDVYVGGGSNDLLVCWTDKVTKYDASSFYNWEMDNLPLHDLEERTHLLWERLGNPTSSITGMSFIVSADATSSCNPLYFTTLSSCLGALPEVINYPILVEVASFSGLGSIEISNKIFGPSGSLEIINRNSAFAGAADISNNAMTIEKYTGAYTDYPLASSINTAGKVLTNIAANASAPSLAFDLLHNQIYTVSGFLASATTAPWDDIRFNNPYVFSRKVSTGNNRLTAALSSVLVPFGVGSTIGTACSSLNFNPFDSITANRSGEYMDSYDASTLDLLDSSSNIAWGDSAETNNVVNAAAAFAYFNSLDSIKITGCNGPIYIRNFNVDGQHVTEKGIEIVNSTVNLERCSVSRCKSAGLYASNSEVNLLRGFVAFRNYGWEDGLRVGMPWKSKVSNYLPSSSYGAGIHALNSTVNLQSTYNRDVSTSWDGSAIIYGAGYTGDVPCPSQEALYCLSRNDIGLHAVNSTILGGRTELAGSSTPRWRDATQLIAELNTEAGIKLSNSVLENSGRLLSYGNYIGLDSVNSTISLDVFKAQNNQKEGIRLKSTELTYGKDAYRGYLHTDGLIDAVVARTTWELHQVALLGNGTQLKMDDSSVHPLFVSAMPSINQSFFVSGATGKSTESSIFDSTTMREGLPAIILNNSNLDAVHAAISTERDGLKDNFPIYGEAIQANNGSKVTLRGSKSYANIVFGGRDLESQKHKAGIYATGGSVVRLQGPSVVSRFSVDVLTDNNSTLEITPHRDSDGQVMSKTFGLDDKDNHTMVELHSTRACLVSDHGSVIKMDDVGSYNGYWPVGGTYGAALDMAQFDYLSQTEDATYVSSVSGGYVQFYPNAISDGLEISQYDANAAVNNLNGANWLAAFTNQTEHPAGNSVGKQRGRYLYPYVADEFAISAVTTGGMCVKALNQSKVDINNTHFPTGWPNTSSVIYDLSGIDGLGPACTRLFMWNIADNSQLNAKYITVSGSHPRDAGYTGPSGTWFSASGLPNTTPDTSSMSILDYYGKAEKIIGEPEHLYAKTTSENYGAFRLYFSVDPAVNALVVPAQDAAPLSGYPIQVYSQGYQFSGNLSAPGEVSAQYISLLHNNNSSGPFHNNSSTTLSDTGYFYAGNVLHSPTTIKALLEDSAANTFANAKHNSVGKSGLAKLVHTYYAYNDLFPGDSNSTTTAGTGVGSVNNFDLEKDN